MDDIARTPAPPYYAVVFTSLHTGTDEEEYGVTAERMAELAREQPGFLGFETTRSRSGLGITVSYWRDLEDIRSWRRHAEHRLAQEAGKSKWYRAYRLRVCRVEQDFGTDPERAAPVRRRKESAHE